MPVAAVAIGRRWLQTGQDFTFEVSAERVLDNGRFIREIVTGPFRHLRSGYR